MRFHPLLHSPLRWALGTFVVGALSSAWLAQHQKEKNFVAGQSAFEALSGNVAVQVQERMRLYEYGLRGARGAVLTAGEQGISHRLFQQYSQTRDVDTEFPGARGFGFIRKVPPASEAAFVRKAQAGGRPDFTVRTLQPHPQDRLIIEYIEPVERNGPAVGLDIGSESNRRQAAITALQTGKATLTAPITLLQATGEPQRSLLFLLPIYREGATPATLEEREAKGFGWSYAPLALGEVLADFDMDERHYDLAILDITNPGAREPIFASRHTAAGANALFNQSLEIGVYGRLWRIDTSARPAFAQSLGQLQPTTILVEGLLASALLAMLVGTLRRGQERKRKNALQQGQLATIVENSADAIVGESPDGKIIIWNQAATQLFGFTQEQALGKSLPELLLPHELRHEEVHLISEVLSKGAKAAFDTERLHRDGKRIAVSVTAGAVRDKKGRIVGVAKFIRDIRERMATEHKLRDFAMTLDQQVKDRTTELETTRHDLQTVLDSVPSMIGFWDKNLRNRVANRAYSSWFGKDPEALAGRTIQELLGADLFEHNRPYIEAALRGEAQQFERSIPRMDGSGMRHSLVNYLPDMVNGEAQGFYAIVHDITDVVESRETAARERERLAHIIAGTNVGTWEWNIRTNALRINERWAEILGFTIAELEPVTNQTWVERAHPQDLVVATDLLRKHFRGELTQYQGVMRIKHKAGHWVWVQSNGRVFNRTPDGKPEWMYGTHQDITAMKAVEERLQSVVATLEGVLTAATEIAIIATDPHGVITVFNAGAQKMLGYTAQEMVGLNTPTLLHVPQETMAYGKELSERYGYGHPIEGFDVFVHEAKQWGVESREWTYVRKDGSSFRVLLAVTTIRDAVGQIIGYLGMAQDMTERHSQDQLLRHAKVQAETANAAKSMFLANMSHEIRTPMNAVLGVAHLLTDTALDSDQRQLLAKLQIAGRSLLGIINDVLDLSKIEAGEMTAEQIPFELSHLVGELQQLYSGQAHTQGVALEMQVAHGVPAVVVGDPTRLRQVLANLISNALKFTQRGTVTLTVSLACAPSALGDPTELHFAVRDTGEGIAPEAQQRLFTPFVQADATTTRRFGGTGLGLSIVKHLSQLMGGSVDLTSTLGTGSEFTVTLPFIVSSKEALPTTQTAVNAGLRVMVVDDNDIDRTALVRLCRAFGWRTTECSSGADMVSQLQQWADSEHKLPDAVLVDWQMPEMDGVQALQLLASGMAGNQLPATLVISAHEREQITAVDHGHIVHSILTKPVDASTLFNAVNTSVARHTGFFNQVMESTQLDVLQGQWLAGLHILLVDDSDINLEVAQRLLQRQGAKVQSCLNGRNALEALATPGAVFDAVLMDVHMPVMDGYEATQRIRTDLGLKRLPVIALTAGALSEERRRAQVAGMDHFLTKPLDPSLLVRTLRRAIANARGTDLMLREPGISGPLATQPLWPVVSGIDANDAAHRLQGDGQLFLSLLERLLHEYAAGIPVLGIQAAPNDRLALAASVHKLRGSAGMLGARELHTTTSDLEIAIRSGENEGATAALTAAANNALEQLRTAAMPVIHAHHALPSSNATSPAALPPHAQPPIAEQDLDRLLALLQDQDLAAAEQFHTLEAQLTTSMNADTLSALRHAIESLAFTAAADVLSQWRAARG